jgi:chorismate mutase
MTGLDPYRRRLDALDEEIARLLGARFEICREIALHKRAHGIPMMQAGRVAEVRARYRARGAESGLPPDFTSALFELLIAATCRMEANLAPARPSERILRAACTARTPMRRWLTLLPPRTRIPTRRLVCECVDCLYPRRRGTLPQRVLPIS